MRKTLIGVGALVALTCLPHNAFAWGSVGHRLIMRRAIDLLPPQIKPFFERFRDELVVRVIDPDQWRVIGWEENPNHFVDFGVSEYGKFPFKELPREYGAALEKFGDATLKRYGLLPWREAEMFGNLVRAFEGFSRDQPYTVTNVVLFSAVASHYLQDAHQPLHATVNYDGADTGNHGIHARFERDLIERFEPRLRLNPAAPTAMTNPRDASFAVLLESYQLVDMLLEADRDAVAGKDTYDDEYFERFFVGVQPILERRLSESISATAGLIVGAWDQAGKPKVSIQEARPIQKVRAPRGR
ncbi:MAG: hypothetical protein GEU82_00305 [Luteitalea sp.]|nr:hypothetical protein [Luteitalea sp.]